MTRLLEQRVQGREDGMAPIEMALTVAFWLIPIAILVISLPTWVERQSLGRLAAQEAAREVVLADSRPTGEAAALQIVTQLAANHDVPVEDVRIVRFDGDLQRGGEITAVVTVQVPALALPLITRAPGFALTFSHTEVVDEYRSFSP